MMQAADGLEVWGGFECTVARVGDGFRNEIVETGHAGRIEDLDAVAALGIRTLRYPALWETVSPDRPDRCDWRWCDERFGRMRELEITPIAGLVHHGSGPLYTNLLDPAFPELLAKHAAAVARRYPWVSLFTPVNEPLTTARFSALGGHWYPHAQDTTTFLRALVNQCRATVLAMRAIRAETPEAKLVQTEDLGRTFGTPALADQVRFENDRRWLSLDLLCGRVDREHPLWRHLVEHGLEGELGFFLDAPCPPDILAINHYLTSERYLDENLDPYPEQLHGGNDFRRYADAEAVRTQLPAAELGPAARLREAWHRFRLPLVVGEVHHGCSREEQLRWLRDVWGAAGMLRREGADIRAVTVWALAGTYDWNSLLTERTGFYEAGAFDVRSARPRLTAIGQAAGALARTGRFDHPVLDGEGWWRREEHRYHPRRGGAGLKPKAARPLLLVRADNRFGRELAVLCAHRGLAHIVAGEAELGGKDGAAVSRLLDRHGPWAVVDAGGPLDRAALPGTSDERRRPCDPAAMLAVGQACAARGLGFVHFSSPVVFDGASAEAYAESDAFTATDARGRAQARAERELLDSCPGALLVRTGALFGSSDRDNFILETMRALEAGRTVQAPGGTVLSPTFVPDLVHAALDLLIDGETGLWHMANRGSASWAELAALVAAQAGIPFEAPAAPDPAQVRMRALRSGRSTIMPSLQSALLRFLRDRGDGARRVEKAA